MMEGSDNKQAMTELREHFFGSVFELLSHDKYAEIWVLDEKDPFTSVEGGESVADVCSRLLIALTTLEAAYQGCNIILVSHGDPLQIFQTILHAAKHKTSTKVDISSRIKQVIQSYHSIESLPYSQSNSDKSNDLRQQFSSRLLVG